MKSEEDYDCTGAKLLFYITMESLSAISNFMFHCLRRLSTDHAVDGKLAADSVSTN